MDAKQGKEDKDFWILDDTLRITIQFEKQDGDLSDNVKLAILESCPADEKLFIADETNIFITREEALKIANRLLEAVERSASHRQE